MRILIADDDLTSRLVLQATLKKLGHIVTSASNGVEALSAFDKQGVPLIISDMLMPGMDGLELCRRIRAIARPQYTYFILLTTVGSKSGYLDGMKAGADDFIHKPFDEEMLAARLTVAARILQLQSHVRQLSGLLPICSVCKKVRDDKNYWHEVESYLSQKTETRFSHGYCPSCFDKIRKEIEAMATAAQAQ